MDNYSVTCEICGRVETGVTNLLEDCFIECESGHLICINHIEDEYSIDYIKQEIISKLKILTGKDNLKENFHISKTLFDILVREEIPDDFRIPTSICPVCNFKSVSNLDLEKYKEILLRKSNEELEKEVFKKFKDYNEFKEFLTLNEF